MATEEVAQVDVAQFRVVLLNEPKLVSQHIAPVLQSHLRKVAYNLDHITCLNVVLDPQVVEETNESFGLTPKQPSAVLALQNRKLELFKSSKRGGLMILTRLRIFSFERRYFLN